MFASFLREKCYVELTMFFSDGYGNDETPLETVDSTHPGYSAKSSKDIHPNNPAVLIQIPGERLDAVTPSFEATNLIVSGLKVFPISPLSRIHNRNKCQRC